MRIELILLSALMLGGVAANLSADENKAVDPTIARTQQMIDDAEKARAQAASVGGEWRDTAKIIEEAQESLNKGNAVAAMKLAAQAHKQAVLGYQQMINQKELKMPSYLVYEKSGN